MKKTFAFILSLILLAGLTACAPSDRTPAQLNGESESHDEQLSPGIGDPEPTLPPPPMSPDEVDLDPTAPIPTAPPSEEYAALIDHAQNERERQSRYTGMINVAGYAYEEQLSEGAESISLGSYNAERPDLIRVVSAQDDTEPATLEVNQSYVVYIPSSNASGAPLEDADISLTFCRTNSRLRLIAEFMFGDSSTVVYAEDYSLGNDSGNDPDYYAIIDRFPAADDCEANFTLTLVGARDYNDFYMSNHEEVKEG